MRPEPAALGKNSDIEILRAFAILYTIILHFGVLLDADSILLVPPNYLDLTVGVDLFLVISGFVIAGSVIESTADPAATRRSLMFSFWIKRFFRLQPAAWTWVGIACAAQFLVMAVTDIPYQARDILIRMVAALGNFMNLYNPYCIANNGVDSCFDNYLGHYWSLSLEEQFYLVFPFVFFFLSRRVLVGLLVVAILAQFFWQRPFFTYAWYFKTDALCWGIGLALLARTGFYRRHLPFVFNYKSLATASGLILLACLPLLAAQVQGVGGYMKKPYGVGLVALFCAAIVWLATYDRNIFSLGPRYRRLMLYFGSRSYSLYLSHMVVFLGSRDLFGQFGQELATTVGPAGFNAIKLAAALALTLLGAELTYRFVETVLRAKGRVIAARVVATHRAS